MEINGKPVRDATKKIIFEITEDDCKKGKTLDPGGCAAAIALRHTNDDKIISARVHRGMTYVEYSTHWKRFLTSQALKTELTVFDRVKEYNMFEPGTYSISPPVGAQTLEGAKLAYARYIKRKKDKRKRHDQGDSKRFRHDITHIRPRGANK